METTIVITGFFIIAYLYSVVGHGGASGYIAWMVLVGFGQSEIRPLALEFNIIVSLIATVQFFRSGYFLPRLFWPFTLTSVPLAWIGGTMQVDVTWFRILLGICLVAAIMRLLLSVTDSEAHSRPPLILALVIGAFIGLLSGMIGIGGGVLLSPVLLLARWSDQKQASAIAAPFILVNSIAALLAGGSGFMTHVKMPYIIPAVVIGGILGSVSGSHKFGFRTIRYVLATVLLIALVKLVV